MNLELKRVIYPEVVLGIGTLTWFIFGSKISLY
jgi:hypothetical protein